MGITAFEKIYENTYLTGSFTGLFTWNAETGEVLDGITGEPFRGEERGRPVGENKITGIISLPDNLKYFIDYGRGIIPLNHNIGFTAMPEIIIDESRFYLWNLCLEIHTGRIFENLTGGFYILIVPLTGIAGITVVVSGYLMWRRKYRKKNK
jgi:hypothetical protein